MKLEKLFDLAPPKSSAESSVWSDPAFAPFDKFTSSNPCFIFSLILAELDLERVIGSWHPQVYI